MNNFPPEIRAYTPICLCGKGAYGAVWLVTDATGVWLALKIVYKNSLGGDWQREFSGVEYYRNKVSEHANLIRIHHIEDCGTFFYYTMDCADNLSPDAKEYCPATKPSVSQSESVPIKTVAVPSPKPIPVTKAKVKKASAKAPPKFVPVRKNAKDLSRRDYKDVQEDIVEYISRRKNLKDIIPDYQNIPAEDVKIDSYYAHEKGGKVYEFIIPSQKIKGAIRLQYMGAISYRELEEFYFNGKKIDPYQ